jgi:hypothetical protein
MKTFRKEYQITLEEEEGLAKKLAEMIKDEVFMNAHTKAEEAVEEVLSMEDHHDANMITISWRVRFSIGNFKTMLGGLRRKKK